MSKYCFIGVDERQGSLSPQFNVKEMKEDGLDGVIISFGNWNEIPVFGGGYAAVTAYLAELLSDPDIELYMSDRTAIKEIEAFLLSNVDFIGKYFRNNLVAVDPEMFVVKGLDNIRKIEEDSTKDIGVILETIFV